MSAKKAKRFKAKTKHFKKGSMKRAVSTDYAKVEQRVLSEHSVVMRDAGHGSGEGGGQEHDCIMREILGHG